MKKTDILHALSYLTQLGLSIAAPPVLCILAGLWLQRRCALGDWVIVVSLIVGLISGACSFLSFARTVRAKTETKEDTDHEAGQDHS
ncbi:MAG: AtpZ/AtpI family protein [Clostridia bacterium]|nr:AtpZ/AtpI family protein [Clostridia bacterium]